MPSAVPGSVSALPLAELGTSVRSPRVAARLDPAQRLGQAPVDHQRLAVLADDDVARLDVAVQDAAAVGVVDRVADVDEPPQELAQLQRPAAGVGLQRLVGVEALDGLLEAVALDEPHGVVGPAVAVGAQAVDRDDPRVLQPAGDLGLEQEPLAAGRVVGVVVEDLLERHLAVQLGVEGHEHGPQAAPGVRPEHAEPLAVAGGRADGVGCRAVGIAVLGRAVCRGDVAERRLDVRVADPRQALARRLAGRDRGQALLHVAAVGFQVNRGQRLQQRPLGGGQVAAGFQVVGQAPGLVERPGLEGGHELALVDEPVLEREQSEEEMAVGGGGHGEAPGHGVVPGTTDHGTEPGPGWGIGSVASGLFSHGVRAVPIFRSALVTPGQLPLSASKAYLRTGGHRGTRVVVRLRSHGRGRLPGPSIPIVRTAGPSHPRIGMTLAASPSRATVFPSRWNHATMHNPVSVISRLTGPQTSRAGDPDDVRVADPGPRGMAAPQAPAVQRAVGGQGLAAPRRHGDPERLPLLRRRLRPAHLHQGRPAHRHRGRPAQPDQPGHALPQGGQRLPARRQPAPRHAGPVPGPVCDKWETKPLDWAMDQIARRVKDGARRRASTRHDEDGRRLNSVHNMGTLGGATLDNEENYLIKKLFTAGLGVVSVENQARI